jgi:hypothetical protein
MLRPPMVEALNDPRNWHIESAEPHDIQLDPKLRILKAPLDGSTDPDIADLARRWALARAAWQPADDQPKLRKYSEVVRQAATQFVAQQSLLDSGMSLDGYVNTSERIEDLTLAAMHSRSNDRVWAMGLLATHADPTGQARIRERIPRDIRKSVEALYARAQKIVTSTWGPDTKAARIAKILREELPPMPRDVPPLGIPGHAGDEREEEDSGEGESEEAGSSGGGANTEREGPAPDHEIRSRAILGSAVPQSLAQARWTAMMIDEPPLKRNHLLKRMGRRYRNSDEGQFIRHIHRHSLDQMIFGVRRPQIGGTILVDSSSSMAITHEQIAEIVYRAPHATIALYSGEYNESGGRGILRIVARRGFIAERQYLHSPAGGANMIDGPALWWLGHQPGPRIWISDGEVTGPWDHQTSGHKRVAEALVKRFRIKRVPKAAQALKEFRRHEVSVGKIQIPGSKGKASTRWDDAKVLPQWQLNTDHAARAADERARQWSKKLLAIKSS